MINVCCVNAGNYLGRGAEYTNKLFDMVRRNLREGIEGKFTVFTDCVDGYDEGIEIRPLPVAGLDGWWNKLALFKAGVFEDGDRVLYFDLDTVICGPLEAIADYSGDFIILRDFYRPEGLQSSVMAWQAGMMNHVWEEWDRADRPQIQGGDQAWIEITTPRAELWQTVYPDYFVSYKVHCRKQPPKLARVVVFHGLPRPHECEEDWMRAVWKVGGGSAVELEHVCNTEEAVIFSNVRSASSRDLPWLEMATKQHGQAVIIGGGPSLADSLDEIRWRASLGQIIFATNGSVKFLVENGIVPDYHVLLDARADNIEFVRDAVPMMDYLVASQCSPDMFETLGAGRGANDDDQYNSMTILFHPLIEGIAAEIPQNGKPVHLVGGGSTVGLKSIAIAYIMGYRKFHLYGFDSSYRDDQHHAYDQAINNGERVLDVTAGGRNFKAAPWMIQQANEFQELAAYLANEDCVITVAGDGLLPHVARQMIESPAVTPADVRADELIKRLPALPVMGVELGVFAGDMSARLLARRPDLYLMMVDAWEGEGASYVGDSGDWHAGLSQPRQDAYKARAEAVTEFAKDRRLIIQARSVEAAAMQEDGLFDFVFIDADHSYEGCSADIAAWFSKLKPGGLLCGHDYENTDFPKFGVTRAVNEWAEVTGLALEFGENFTWFCRMPDNREQTQEEAA